jgi:hypothetical protein
LDGLIGIIDTGELWASNASFLNDRRELIHGLEASVDAVQKLASKAYQSWKPVLDEAVSALSHGKIPDTYVLCFCSHKDALSQWRGYGGGEQSVGLIFDRVELSKRLRRDKARLMKVIYGSITTADKMTTELKRELDDFDTMEAIIGGAATERQKDAVSILSRLIPQFKHIGFADEREWRYVVQRSGDQTDVCFRRKGNVVVPYIKLAKSGRDKLPLLEVIVGPGRDPELTTKSLKLYLKSKCYGENFWASHSIITAYHRYKRSEAE